MTNASKERMWGIPPVCLCAIPFTAIASLSVIKETFESDEPIKGTSIFSQPRCLASLPGFREVWHIVACELPIPSVLTPLPCTGNSLQSSPLPYRVTFTDISISLLVSARMIYLQIVIQSIPAFINLICHIFKYYTLLFKAAISRVSNTNVLSI